jgi:hypothetical protein
MLGESDEFRRLRHAVEKAAGDRRIRNVCRLCTVNRFNAALVRGRAFGARETLALVPTIGFAARGRSDVDALSGICWLAS